MRKPYPELLFDEGNIKGFPIIGDQNVIVEDITLELGKIIAADIASNSAFVENGNRSDVCAILIHESGCLYIKEGCLVPEMREYPPQMPV